MLEAVVSMLLLAAGTVMISQIFPASGRLERGSRESFVSSLRIQMKLFDLEQAGSVRPGVEEGVFDESTDRWKLTVIPSPVPGFGLAHLEILDARGNPLTNGQVDIFLPMRKDG